MEGEVTLENFTFSDDKWNCLYGHLLLQPTDTTELTSPHSRLLNYLWSKSEHFAEGGVIGGEVDEIVATAERKRGSYSHTYGNVYTGGTSSSLKISPSLQREIDGESNNQSEALVRFASSAKPQGPNFCNRSWDGLLCWPETQEGDSVTLSCFKELGGIHYDETRTVTRFCEGGGLWQNKTDYSECIPKVQPTTETPIGTHDVYFAGYCLSLFALTIAMVIFLVFKELRCLRNTIHTHLIITYILADALWLITSIQSHIGHQTQASCITFILLHYFHLTNFFWMFVEGLYLYILVVQTFMAENVKFRVYAFVGWGIPLLVVAAWSLAKWWTQQKVETESDIFTCFWLNVNLYDWIYKLPAIVVLAANSIFLIQIMWVLITKLRSATNPETQQSRKAAKALVVLMPLLGITYVLVLRGSSQTPAYEIIRALLISTQGFLVALLFCFLNGEVRIALRHRWNRLRSMGPGFGCCEERGHMQQMRDWSPRSRTESIRLYTPTQTTPNNRKRESIASETVMTTVIGTGSVNGNNTAQPLLVTASPRRLSTATITKTYNATDSNLL